MIPDVKVVPLPYGVERTPVKGGFAIKFIEPKVVALNSAVDAAIEASRTAGKWPSPQEPMLVAERLIRVLEGTAPLRYMDDRWLKWIGPHWKELGQSEIRRSIYQILSNAHYYDAKTEVNKPWNPKRGSVADVEHALPTAAWMDMSVAAPAWLADPDGTRGAATGYVSCANGLLRVADRNLMPHSKDFFNFVSVPFEFAADAPVPSVWLKTLGEWFPDDPESVAALQEWAGYVVSGRTDLQKMFVLIGATRSGKGTFAFVLENLIGRGNCVGPNPKSLTEHFGLEPLLNKSLATIPDARGTFNGKEFVEALLMINGEDTISVPRKYKTAWNGKLPTRMQYISNEAPSLPDASGAVIGRMVVVNFPRSFLHKEDSALRDKLSRELPGILNWALEGLQRLTARGRFVQPESGKGILNLVAEGASPVTEFVTERCVRGPEEEVSAEQLYLAWRHWCESTGHKAGTSATLGRALRAAIPIDDANKGGFARRRKGPRGQQAPTYLGLGLPKSPFDG